MTGVEAITKVSGGWHISRTVKEDASLDNDWDGSWDYAHSLGINLCRLTVLLPKVFADGSPYITVSDAPRNHIFSCIKQIFMSLKHKWSALIARTKASTVFHDPSAARKDLSRIPPRRVEHLHRLTDLFEKCRTSNSKFIIRFYYAGGGDPPSLDFLESDLNCFADLLRTNADVILCVQAGFIGKNWGEWWGSAMAPDEDFGTDPRVEAAKRLVVNKLLATGIQVCLRYPRDISTYFADMRNIGWHDDAILAQGPGGRDAGTFDKGGSHWRHGDLASSQKFTRNRIKGIRGGECCCDAGTVPSLDDLLEFVKEYRICYLNVEYPEVVFKQFRKGDEVIDKITAELKENGRVFATSLEKGGS